LNVSASWLVWTGAMIHGTAGLMRGAEGRALARGREDASIEPDWFRSLGERDLDRAYRLAGFLLGDATEAQDATQDALTRAWGRRDRLRSDASAQAWFDRILVNVCRDRMRRRRVIRWTPMSEGESNAAADPFAAALARDAFLRTVAELDVDQRIVVVLRFAADLSIDAIAERLAVPPGTVKSRLHYAMRRLRQTAEAGDAGRGRAVR
jgi:RNA polymerase sigma-70 factor (ECF subfamily)